MRNARRAPWLGLLVLVAAPFASGAEAAEPPGAGPDALSEEEAAAARLAALCGRQGPEATRAIVEALPQARASLRPLLVRSLSGRSGPAVVPTLLAAARGEDAVLAEEAVRALRRVGGQEAAEALVQAAQGAATARGRALALQAAIAAAHALAERAEAPRAAALFQRLFPLAQTLRDRRDIVRGLGKAGHPATRRLLEPLAADREGPLRGPALDALVAIADASTASRRDAAVAIYKQVIDAEPAAGLADEAARKLLALGVHYSPAARQGYIVSWWILGPFGCRDFRHARKARPPEHGVDLTATRRDGGRELRWQSCFTLHPEGRVDLKALLSPGDRVLAYAYTEITAPQPTPVKFLVRRDDGLTLWLNGKKLYEAHTPHGADQEEFAVDAALAPGTNRLLVKCSQGGGAWEFSVRMTDPAGQPFAR